MQTNDSHSFTSKDDAAKAKQSFDFTELQEKYSFLSLQPNAIGEKHCTTMFLSNLQIGPSWFTIPCHERLQNVPVDLICGSPLRKTLDIPSADGLLVRTTYISVDNVSSRGV